MNSTSKKERVHTLPAANSGQPRSGTEARSTGRCLWTRRGSSSGWWARPWVFSRPSRALRGCRTPCGFGFCWWRRCVSWWSQRPCPVLLLLLLLGSRRWRAEEGERLGGTRLLGVTGTATCSGFSTGPFASERGVERCWVLPLVAAGGGAGRTRCRRRSMDTSFRRSTMVSTCVWKKMSRAALCVSTESSRGMAGVCVWCVRGGGGTNQFVDFVCHCALSLSLPT